MKQIGPRRGSNLIPALTKAKDEFAMALSLMPEVGPPVQLSEIDETFSQPGVYFLWQSDAIVYVGQARHMTNRIMQHVTEGKKRFDGVSCKPTGVRDLAKVERYFIEALLPKYNRCGFSESIRKIWVGHMDSRPMPDRRVSREVAAEILGLDVEQVPRLHQHGLPCYRQRRRRNHATRTSYSVRDLHQFAAQKPEMIIEARKKVISPFARHKS